MATTTEAQAIPAWRSAEQTRELLIKILGKIQSFNTESIDERHLQEVEDVLAACRLASVTAVFMETKLAQEKDIEESLWKAHTKVNTVYRQIREPRRGPKPPPVLRNKLEKRYRAFLKTSQQFYKAFVQRLAARYALPAIQYLVQGLGMEPMQEKDRVDPVAIQVDGYILKLCYRALIHLGDLARYRYQSQPKEGQLKSALTYYSLAHNLVPEDGLAHNQMGVIFNEMKRHLDIAYSFYRAKCCKIPHPSAKKNLELEFSRVLQPAFMKQNGGPSTPETTLKSWFVRLHANFYQGERFASYEELENEVLHRLGMAWKSSMAAKDDILLRIILVNFAAYHIAQKGVKGRWTLSNSRFCQFTLRLIVRTTLSLANAVQSEISTSIEDRRRPSPDGVKPEVEPFSPVFEGLLPLFRLTCAWLVYHHHDVVQYDEYISPYVKDMHRMVAKAQTAFARAFGDKCREATNIAPYLLPEDQESVGHLAMDNADVFYALRLQYGQDGKLKPRATTRASASTENWWRIRDVLNCGIFLVADPMFPLQLVDKSGHSEMVYCEDVPVQPLQASPETALMAPGLFDEAMGLLRDQPQSTVSPQTTGYSSSRLKSPPTLTNINHSVKQASPRYGTKSVESPSYVGAKPAQPSTSFTTAPAPELPAPSAKRAPYATAQKAPTLTSEATDDSMENLVLHMVDDIVGAESTASEPRDTTDSSHGLSSSVNELRSKLPAPDATTKAFPTLPWNYFYDATGSKNGGNSFGSAGQPGSSNLDVYQKIYGSSFGKPSLGQPNANKIPGWTTSEVGSLSATWGPASSPGINNSRPMSAGITAQSPQAGWAAVPVQPQSPRAAGWGSASTHAQGSKTTKSPATSGWGVPPADGQTAKANSHDRSASQGNYDALYQRLARMTAQDSTNGDRQRSPLGGDVRQPTPLARAQQGNTVRSSVSPSSPTAFPYIGPSNPTTSQWPQYQNSFAATTGGGVGLAFHGSSSFSPNSSVWASTPCNTNYYDSATASGRGTMASKDDPTSRRNQALDAVWAEKKPMAPKDEGNK